MLRPAPTLVPLTEADMREYTEARKAQSSSLLSPGLGGLGSPLGGATPAAKLTAAQRIGLQK